MQAGLIAMLATQAAATTRLVPEEYGSVQAAVDACQPGDVVSVGPGEYAGRVTMREGVTLSGRPGEGGVVLRGLEFNALSSDTRVEHVTVRGGEFSQGGGARIVEASPTLADCTFEGNSAPAYYDYRQHWWFAGLGGAIAVSGSAAAPHIERCVFRGNRAAGNGGAIYSIRGSLTIVDCVFESNQAVVHEGGEISGYGGALYLGSGTAVVRGSIVRDNTAFGRGGDPSGGGGVWIAGGNVVVEDCEIAWNQAQSGYAEGGRGAGICALGSSNSRATIRNCSVAFNSATGPGGGMDLGFNVRVESCIVAFAFQGAALSGTLYEIACSDVFGNAGGDGIAGVDLGGNFSLDPGFCDAVERQLTLHANSPCLPGRHPAGSECGQIGAWGKACGGTPTDETSFGGLRARFGPGARR